MKQNGLPIETFIEVFIEDKLEEVKDKPQEKPFYEAATTEEWLAEFHRWLDSHKDKNYLVLPDEAYSRENIYWRNLMEIDCYQTQSQRQARLRCANRGGDDGA